jgi:cell division protein FtsL
VLTRLNVLLLVALLGSSFYLVRVSYETRSLFAALDRAQGEERLLESQHDQLLAEKQSQATPLRVEKTAREKLGMRSATPAVTQYVSAPGVAASGAGRK